MRGYPDTNVLIIEGRLTADPDRKYRYEGTPDEYPCTTFKVINNRNELNPTTGKRTKRNTPLLCRAYGEVADAAFEYLKKGRIVFLQGRLAGEHWHANGPYARSHKLVMHVKAFAQMDSLPRMTAFDPFEQDVRMPGD